MLGSPDPASVCSPSMKSIVSDSAGRGKGAHSACSGRVSTAGLIDKKQFWMFALVSIFLYPSGQTRQRPGHTLRGDTELTVSCCWPYAVHISAIIVCSRRCKRRICYALGIQAKPDFLRIILCDRQGTRNHLRLVSVAPTMLICVGVVLSGGLLALCVAVMKDLGHVLNRLSFLDWGGHDEGCLEKEEKDTQRRVCLPGRRSIYTYATC